MECLRPWVSVFRWGPEWLDAHFFQSNAARCFQPEILLASVNGCGSAPSVRREMTAPGASKSASFCSNASIK